MPDAMNDATTREFCQRCQRVSPVGFHARNDIWQAVAGRWQHSILCLLCFAALGDEKHVAWEEGIEFYPVSYATHHAAREDRELKRLREWEAGVIEALEGLPDNTAPDAIRVLRIRLGEMDESGVLL